MSVSGGQQQRGALCNVDRVFIVSRQGAVGCSYGPSVCRQHDSTFSRCDDGLDCKDQTLQQPCTGRTVLEIGYGWFFMDRAANTVTTEFGNDIEALRPDLAFHFTANMRGSETDTRHFHRFPKGSLCAAG